MFCANRCKYLCSAELRLKFMAFGSDPFGSFEYKLRIWLEHVSGTVTFFPTVNLKGTRDLEDDLSWTFMGFAAFHHDEVPLLDGGVC